MQNMQRNGAPSCVIIPITHRACSLLHTLPKSSFLQA